MADIIGKNISKVYNNQIKAVEHFNFHIQQGEFLVIVGPSGSGKTTLLKMIAGLESITKGTLFFNDKVMNGIPPGQRNVSMVFQSFALFPHLSVYDNIVVGMSQNEKKSLAQKLHNIANLLEIETLLDRKPITLSGGQQQRVSIARALVRDCEFILMDEPLSNLDGSLRIQMRQELISIHKKVATTFLYVTHDYTEAMTLADRMIVMKDGLLQQIGTPYELYHAPKNTFVAQFLGYPIMNLCKGTIRQDGISLFHQLFAIKHEKIENDMHLIIGIRPEDVAIVDFPTAILFHIDRIQHLGKESILYGFIDEKEFQIKVSTWFDDHIKHCYIKFSTLYIFDTKTDELLFRYNLDNK